MCDSRTFTFTTTELERLNTVEKSAKIFNSTDAALIGYDQRD